MAECAMRAVAILCGWCAVHPAAAQTAPGAALVTVFEGFCLRHFPEPARVEDAVTARLTPMAKEQVARYLHDDPGRGWSYRDGRAEYVLTVEDPPFHTCAVRAAFPATPDYAAAWQRAGDAWAAAGRHLPFVTAAPQVIQRGPLGIVGHTRTADGGRGDVLLDIVTTYPDGHVELRLARRALLPGQRP